MRHGTIALLACLLFWTLLFRTTGLFSSGFHLVDEHALVEIANDLAAPDATLSGVMRKWVAMDLGERRFRPLYYASRVLRSALFGSYWPAWSTYNAVLVASTSAALFVFGRLIGLTTISSIALAALSTLGRPSTIWWRLGTPETEGNLLVALALMLMALAVVKPEHRVRSELSAFMLAVLASLTKEGMILYLPAIAAIRVWLPCWLYGSTLKSALMDARLFIIALGLLAGAEILILARAVGTAGTGYAGVDARSFDPDRLWASLEAVDLVAAFWIPAAATALTVSAGVFLSRPHYRPTLPLITGWLVFLIAAMPQVLLYSKSGWADHYFNPLVISCALLMASTVDRLRRVHQWLYLIFAVLVLVQINQRFKWTKQHAGEYAEDGTSLRRLLDAAEGCSQQNEPLLVVANPWVHYEEAFSLRTYLTRSGGQVYLATVGGAGSQIFSDALVGQERARAFLNPVTLEDHYFNGRTMQKLVQPERLGAILVLSPESLQYAFFDGTSDWLRSDRYHATDFEVSGVRVRLMCLDR